MIRSSQHCGAFTKTRASALVNKLREFPIQPCVEAHSHTRKIVRFGSEQAIAHQMARDNHSAVAATEMEPFARIDESK